MALLRPAGRSCALYAKQASPRGTSGRSQRTTCERADPSLASFPIALRAGASDGARMLPLHQRDGLQRDQRPRRRNERARERARTSPWRAPARGAPQAEGVRRRDRVPRPLEARGGFARIALIPKEAEGVGFEPTERLPTLNGFRDR